ncbi:hypothetical protein [Paenibacillus mucilaginosus]|nr:hypothetical protein [Paenibacillus mucilaginosus]MCG7213677.1 hypothetical protein [Paenibacillus mucilaginosus]WDM27517.1 hypothetical protein KCX80_35110 [Paenibacillus mucilaginosus]
MARNNIKVPFGYEPPTGKGTLKGTLWVYDSFEGYTEQELTRLLAFSDERKLARVIFYPLHEETLRRMVKGEHSPYYKRVQALEDMLEHADTDVDYTIESFENKRKKYTPADYAFRFLEEKYQGPFFLYVMEETANLLAGYESFETWIKKVRFFIDGGGGPLHPKLEEYASRWERV